MKQKKLREDAHSRELKYVAKEKKEAYMLEDRIYTLNTYYRQLFGEKVYKLSLNPGTTCPNRDGTCGTGGCSFCSLGGSGEFTPSPLLPMADQLTYARSLVKGKGARKYVAYFQAFTGTYAPLPYLESLYVSVLREPDIAGLCIGTRPDCIPDEVIRLLSALRTQYHKPVFLELGLQTTSESVSSLCNIGYTYDVFENAVYRLSSYDIPVTVHLIFGLPTETKEQMLSGVSRICTLPISGIKLQQLHILRGTAMEKYYEKYPKQFAMMEESCYIDTVAEAITRIPPQVVIHRLTGDGPKKLLVAPLYTADKKHMLSAIKHRLEELDIHQGQALTKQKNQ